MNAIGPYQVVGVLGEGGTSTVLRVIGPQGQHLALKLMRRDMLSPAKAPRFIRELTIQRSLGAEAGFLPILDAGQDAEGAAYLVLPLCDGGSLADRMKTGALGIDETLALAERVALSLSAAHARGIVHRDLKPANLLYTGDGTLLVADLGLAKSVHPGQQSLSHTGVIRGTIDYMPPEQMLDAKRAGPPADVYAWAVIVFECLSGRRPFVGATPMEVLARASTNEAPLLSGLRPDIDPRLADLVQRCLAKDPSERPADGAALLAELRAVTAKPPRPPRRAPLAAAAVGVLGLAGLALALSQVAQGDVDPAQPSDPSAQTPSGDWGLASTELTGPTLVDEPVCLAIDPSGGEVAVGCLDGSVQRFALADGAARGLLLNRERVDALCYGPSPETLFVSNSTGSLERVEVASGQVKRVGEGGTSLARSPDNRRIYTGGFTHLGLVDAAEGVSLKLHRVTSRRPVHVAALADGMVGGPQLHAATDERWLDKRQPRGLAKPGIPVDGPLARVGERLVCRGENGELVAFALLAPQDAARAEPEARVTCLASDPNEERVFVGDDAGGLSCWTLDQLTLRLAWRVAVHHGPVHAVEASADGRVVSAAADGRVVCTSAAGTALWTRAPAMLEASHSGNTGTLVLRGGALEWHAAGAVRRLPGSPQSGARILLDEAHGRAYRVGDTAACWNLNSGEQLGEQPPPFAGARPQAVALRDGSLWVSWESPIDSGVFAYGADLGAPPRQVTAQGAFSALCADGPPAGLTLRGKLITLEGDGPPPNEVPLLELVEAAGGALWGTAGHTLVKLRANDGSPCEPVEHSLQAPLPEQLALSPSGELLASLRGETLELLATGEDKLRPVRTLSLPAGAPARELRFVSEAELRVVTAEGRVYRCAPGLPREASPANLVLERREDGPLPELANALISVDPGGTWIALHSTDPKARRLRIRRVDDGEPVLSLKHSLKQVRAIAFAADARSVWVVGSTGAEELSLRPGAAPLTRLTHPLLTGVHPTKGGTLLLNPVWSEWRPFEGPAVRNQAWGTTAKVYARRDGRGAYFQRKGYSELPFSNPPSKTRIADLALPAIAPSGTTLTFVRGGEVWGQPLAANANPQKLASLPKSLGKIQDMVWGGASRQRAFVRGTQQSLAFEASGDQNAAVGTLPPGKLLAIPGGGVLTHGPAGLQRWSDALEPVKLAALPKAAAGVGLVMVSRDGSRYVYQAGDSMFACEPFEPPAPLNIPPGKLVAASLSQSGQQLAVLKQGVRVYDLDTQRETFSWDPDPDDARLYVDVCFAGESTLLLVGDTGPKRRQRNAIVLGAPKDQNVDVIVRTLPLQGDTPKPQHVKRAGEALAIGALDGGGWVLATTARGLLRHTPGSGSVTVMRSGRLSNARLGANLRSLLAIPPRVENNNGRVTVASRQGLGVDLTRGEHMPEAPFAAVLEEHKAQALGISLGPQGRRLAVLCERLVVVCEGDEVVATLTFDSPCRAASFDASGDVLLTVDAHGGLRRYRWQAP